MTINSPQITEEFLQNKYQDKYLYSVNRNAFSKDSAENIYKRYYGEKFNKEETLYIIFGTDGGLLINYLMKQKRPNGSRFLFIELPQLIDLVNTTLPEDYDQDAFMLTTPDKWQDAAEDMEISIYIYKDKVSFIKSFAAIDAYITDYNEQNVEIVKALEVIFFFTRAMVGVLPFMARQLMNICENRQSSALLHDAFKGRTCIILGGGPSLDNDLAWIKENENNLVIFAVSRISKNLLKHNITPHFIVSVDPYDVSFDVSKELLLLPPNVLFLQGNCVSPALLSQWHGRNLCIGKRFPWHEESDDDATIMQGPTVTNTAIKAAMEMGFSNILLTGVDLCYSQTGISHASESNEAQVGPALAQPGMWVETYSGKKAETLIQFDNAIKGLIEQAQFGKSLGISIYNLSPDAAKAEHIEHIPHTALHFENEPQDIWEILDHYIPALSIDQIRQDNNLVLEKSNNMLKHVKAVKILAEEALICNQQLFKVKGKESENYKHKLRMDKIEKQIDSKYKKASNFIKNFGLDKFVKTTQASHDEWSDEKIEETGRLYYQAYIDTCNLIIEHLGTTIKRIKSRIAEEKPNTKFADLVKQWQDDKHFGRAKVWREAPQRKNLVLDESDEALYQNCVKAFDDIIYNNDTAHLARTKKEASLKWGKRKITILFNQNNLAALQVMNNGLKNYRGPAENINTAKQLFLLSEAFIATLTKDHHKALASFEQIDDEFISEDELQQIASLGIKAKQYDKAVAALERLSKCNTKFIPNYAKILGLVGNTEQAIDQYSIYLEEYPKDTLIWLALGKLYENTNSIESAKIAYQYVLQLEPNNLIAHDHLNNLSV